MGKKNQENNGMEKIDLVTITHAWKIPLEFVLDGLNRFCCVMYLSFHFHITGEKRFIDVSSTLKVM